MGNDILTRTCIGLFLFSMVACGGVKGRKDFVSTNIEHAAAQYGLQVDALEKNDKILIPRTVNAKGDMVYAHRGWDWTLGFFPGSLWYLYDLTGNEYWQQKAEKYTEYLHKEQYNTSHHDIGFIIGCSFLNGMRMGSREEYKPVVVQAAKSLSTRFRSNAGIIQSWNADKGRPLKMGWKCPVIIDNLMNLELLFEATRLSGDSTYYNIAVSHADKTLENHFREDGSSYHVVDYNPETGEVLKRCTAQGYSDESAWARGQAWAIYGYTMCYRYTHSPVYLKQAKKVYEFIFTNSNLPEDLIPYWDFDALNIPNELRDASAATIMASALYELSVFSNNKEYKETADKIMETLSSPAYRAEIGKNYYFLLMHSVGSFPDRAEMDVPLSYADYYYLEALKRKRDFGKH
ncbi:MULTISPECIES: glycoside hydrolase family 88 protein [Bacteroides]|uniref:glycoside hydrolase family 88 protein n=1 Tax=Bacteroides TaxID=816 RepID=UPI000E44B1EC|nr:glucuronyl hydrolase [Bacteroides sp. OM08-11]